MARSKVLAFVVAIAIAGACELAHAQEHAQERAPRWTLEVDSDAPEVISREALADAVGKELGTDGPHVDIVVRYRDADRTLAVRAKHGGGRVVEREVHAEGDTAAIRREAVLLVGNVASDEARELLDALAARPPKSVPTPPPAEPPVEEPPPKPKEAPAPPPEEVRIANIGLVYPIATNFGHPGITTYFDLSIGFGFVGKVKGLQLGAAASEARDIRGVQLAPVTIAADVEGTQIGVINIARHVKGAQVGVINIAEEVDGGTLGILNLHKDAFHLATWGGNLAYLNAGIVWESKWAYTVIGMTYGTFETQLEPRVGTVMGIGLRAPLPAGFDVALESSFSQIDPKEAGAKGTNVWFHERAVVGYRVLSWLRPFVGGGFRAPVAVFAGREVFRPDFVGGVEF